MSSEVAYDPAGDMAPASRLPIASLFLNWLMRRSDVGFVTPDFIPARSSLHAMMVRVGESTRRIGFQSPSRMPLSGSFWATPRHPRSALHTRLLRCPAILRVPALVAIHRLSMSVTISQLAPTASHSPPPFDIIRGPHGVPCGVLSMPSRSCLTA
ncbi:hypothetical protein N657DRAFT_297066 [Parathielavia appendiculata]|uniref:Uncharacterized protein n=1 Tax=Parathielavia appendiculata TaxID=2587402 RepID=A0AAN6U5F8_9PEZI|nr:hypothetical protein N657DRAFT_297066 [Parathielavia appendiculata]